MFRSTHHNETAVYFEDPWHTTIAPTGSRHILLKTTGFASMRATVVLAVRASGDKMTPLIILKGKDSEIEKKYGVWVVYQMKAWVNQTLLKKWLQLVFPSVIDAQGKLLVWDSCQAHIAKDLKSFMKTQGIQTAVIPGGLTAYVQPGDIRIYKSFKDKISPIISEWKTSGTVQLTRGGNPKPPNDEVICNWVKTAWRNVDTDVIKKSIARAGFDKNVEEWHIARHDIFGERFRAMWESNNAEEIHEFEVQEGEEDDPFMLEDENEQVDN